MVQQTLPDNILPRDAGVIWAMMRRETIKRLVRGDKECNILITLLQEINELSIILDNLVDLGSVVRR